MTTYNTIKLASLWLLIALSSVSAFDKECIFILTDIENESDDAQSLVRFLTYANHFDVEGLVKNGLNTPEMLNWGGWGGRYEFHTPRMQKWL